MPSHDYTKTMMMKLFMAAPDGKGGSRVYCGFDRALDIIRQADALTLGVPKILYLVGWQFNGHDDKYPAFDEVNPALKADGDKTALDSMVRLMKEAKQYHTVVSVHINFTDAYDNSPLAEDYRRRNALIRSRDGKPAAIEEYNGLPCYKISYKEEWESGLFQKRVSALLNLLPLREAGTVHVDNFQCYVNRSPGVGIKAMQAYRKKMIEYMAAHGIDVTSEFTYREGRLTALGYGRFVRDVFKTLYPIGTLGQIPAVWWVDKLTKREFFRLYPDKYAGGIPNNKYSKFLYGNIHGEELWKDMPGTWQKEFLGQFAAINVPYLYLASLQKEKLAGRGESLRMVYTNGVVSSLKGQKIAKNGVLLKTGGDLLLPLPGGEDKRIAYSKNGCNRAWRLPPSGYRAARLSDITPEGLAPIGEVPVKDSLLPLELAPGQGLLVELAK